jgi:hypothetical protein
MAELCRSSSILSAQIQTIQIFEVNRKGLNRKGVALLRENSHQII